VTTKADTDARRLAHEIDQEMGRCIHFNGILHDRCRAGVAYESVRGSTRGIPCLKERAEGTTCEAAIFPTREAAEQRVAEGRQSIVEYFAAIRAGKCPLCDKPVEMRQVGACVYGDCGHRLYQGKLAKAAQ
jgi:hypothetical protein